MRTVNNSVSTAPAVDTAFHLHTLHFSTTKTCNLSCAFCYDKSVREASSNLPVTLIEQLAQESCALGCKRIILSGGEPTARKDWRDIAKIFDDLGVEVSLATNGTLITQDTAEFFASLKNCTLSISIDGGRAIHDSLRGKEGAYDSAIAGMNALNKTGINFDLNATIFSKNLSEVAHLAKLSRDFDCNVRLSLLHPNGRGKTVSSPTLTPDEIFRLREFCHVLRQSGVKIYINLPPLLQYLNEIIPGRGAACGWAVNFCGVLSNGDVTVCGVAVDEPELIAGNIQEDSFTNIWHNSELFKRIREFNTKDIDGVCGRCPFNEVCGGACRLSAYREGGDMLAPYPLCQLFYENGYIPDHLLEPVDS
ncbi:MAG: radical SAM protein [Desulfuromonadales bacterium]|nr:radical SAM protein [Desulfuromonadales bacterium]